HLSVPTPGVNVVGLHVHLHGYSAADRATALRECCELIDTLRSCGHTPHFIDLGGGVPMSYIDSAEQWARYQDARAAVLDGYADPFRSELLVSMSSACMSTSMATPQQIVLRLFESVANSLILCARAGILPTSLISAAACR